MASDILPSTKRIPDRAGFVGGTKQPCRWCGKMPEGQRRTFCSDACVHEHKIRTQPGYAAEHVLKRDHGICCQCGLDTVLLFNRLTTSLHSAIHAYMNNRLEYRCCESATWGTWICGHPQCIQTEVVSRSRKQRFRLPASRDPRHIAECDAIGLPPKRRALLTRLWEMDHIVPVVEGGGDCGLDNLRTLCWACHARETATLARRRAERRRSKSNP